jgi:riboflavin synthase
VFTGLIEEMGAVARRSGADLTILAHAVLGDLREGDSVCVSGVCLTAVAVLGDRFVAQMSPETLDSTTLGRIRPGDAVNLERAMALGDRLGGHMVQGHVDGVGRVHSVIQQGDFALWRFQAPPEAGKYLAPKGSVAVDGISLTVVEPQGDTFGVAVIPATARTTTLGNRQPGDAVNIEADIIGKHVYHYLSRTREGGITAEFLARNGFA